MVSGHCSHFYAVAQTYQSYGPLREHGENSTFTDLWWLFSLGNWFLSLLRFHILGCLAFSVSVHHVEGVQEGINLSCWPWNNKNVPLYYAHITQYFFLVVFIPRATCWTRVGVTARCVTPTSTACWSGSASEAPGPVSSAATDSTSSPSRWRDRGRWSTAEERVV